ncbi:MAG: GNAT family N-acetyltransferase [Caulobacteraceae bacterium]
MIVRFYRRAGDAPCEAPDWAPVCDLDSWRPAVDGPPPPGPHAAENRVWYGFDRAGLFASHAFEELSVRVAGRLLHRLIVTPRWFRFPFMAEDDLQIGALWTAPEARRCGLAMCAIAEAHRRHASPGRCFWYVVDDENAASISLAEACGYRLMGKGRRTRPLGVSGLGQFRMEALRAP